MASEASSSVPVADAPLDPSLAPGGELAKECPNYVALVTRALSIAAGEGFGDVRALSAQPVRA